MRTNHANCDHCGTKIETSYGRIGHGFIELAEEKAMTIQLFAGAKSVPDGQKCSNGKVNRDFCGEKCLRDFLVAAKLK